MAVSFDYVIQSEMGLHARPAGQLVKMAKNLSAAVWIEYKGERCEARQLIQLMGMEIPQGASVTFCVEGADEGAAAGELTSFLEEKMI